MKLSEWLDELKRLDAVATKGPWTAYIKGHKVATIAVDIGDYPVGRRPCVIDWPGFESNGLSAKKNVVNARFISASRLALSQAIRIIEAVQKVAQINGPVYDGEVEEIAERIINEPEERKET